MRRRGRRYDDEDDAIFLVETDGNHGSQNVEGSWRAGTLSSELR